MKEKITSLGNLTDLKVGKYKNEREEIESYLLRTNDGKFYKITILRLIEIERISKLEV